MHSNKVVIDVARKTVHFHEDVLSVAIVSESQEGYARSHKMVIIPPESEELVPVKLSNSLSNKIVLLEPVQVYQISVFLVLGVL
jgi:hypothetical protein